MLLWRFGPATCFEKLERPGAPPVEYERKAHVTQNKPVALWAVPRSISTAFERVFVERDDFEVLHEPFSASYYYGADRQSDRFADAEPKAEYSYERCWRTSSGRVSGASSSRTWHIMPRSY